MIVLNKGGVLALGLAALAAFNPAAASAAEVIDQSALATTPGVPAGSGISPDRRQAQIFTAGKSGKLTRVDFQLLGVMSFPVDLAFNLIPGGAGALPLGDPADPIIFTVAPGAGANFALTSLDLSTFNFHIVAGQQYGLLLRSAGSGVAQWVYGSDADGDTSTFADQTQIAYAGGVNNVLLTGSPNWTATTADRGFRTWVQTAAVPEPATWAMLILGFGVIGGALRQRQRQSVHVRFAA